jgi:hypothetical protein
MLMAENPSTGPMPLADDTRKYPLVISSPFWGVYAVTAEGFSLRR